MSGCCVTCFVTKGTTVAGYLLESDVASTFLCLIEEEAGVMYQLFICCLSLKKMSE